MFDFETKEGREDFLDLLWHYVCISQNRERVKREIGICRAVWLKLILADFLDSSEEIFDEFLKNYSKNGNCTVGRTQ